MGITVVGSIGLDDVETPSGRQENVLGGAATFFSLAAGIFAPVHLVGIVGEDFPGEHVRLFEQRNVNLDGMERAPGKTFRWAVRYHADVNERDTLDTQLNVFAGFHPKLPEAARTNKHLFLANIHPALQLEVLDQAEASFIGLDTMNLWISTELDGLKQVLARVDAITINDGEAKQLTGVPNLIKAARAVAQMGPRIVVVKKGEHGCMLFAEDRVFAIPAFPLEDVQDPTGAGDSFAGGFMGYLSQQGRHDFATLCRAAVHGSVLASFACESFGPARLCAVDDAARQARYAAFRQLVSFD